MFISPVPSRGDGLSAVELKKVFELSVIYNITIREVFVPCNVIVAIQREFCVIYPFGCNACLAANIVVQALYINK